MRRTPEAVWAWLWWHSVRVPINALRTAWFGVPTAVCDCCLYTHPYPSLRAIRYVDGSTGHRCHERYEISELMREWHELTRGAR